MNVKRDLGIGDALREAAERLSDVSDTARLDAELLMAAALALPRSEMLLRRRDLGVPAGFAKMLARRMEHEPIAYILGHQEFYGREFKVNSDVLIPRGDSETLIDAALEVVLGGGAQKAGRDLRILDLGTGSGALLLTLLAELPEASGTGVDASPGAVAVARENAEALGLASRAHIARANWAEAGWADGLGLFDLIVANPPYVEADADLAPSVIRFEPPQALFAGQEGLDDYRILIPQLRSLLRDNGVAVFEIGYEQAEAVTDIAATSGFSCRLFRDLARRPRALLLEDRTLLR